MDKEYYIKFGMIIGAAKIEAERGNNPYKVYVDNEEDLKEAIEKFIAIGEGYFEMEKVSNNRIKVIDYQGTEVYIEVEVKR